jgi:hypothetical protein
MSEVEKLQSMTKQDPSTAILDPATKHKVDITCHCLMSFLHSQIYPTFFDARNKLMPTLFRFRALIIARLMFSTMQWKNALDSQMYFRRSLTAFMH